VILSRASAAADSTAYNVQEASVAFLTNALATTATAATLWCMQDNVIATRATAAAAAVAAAAAATAANAAADGQDKRAIHWCQQLTPSRLTNRWQLLPIKRALAPHN
jgi:hypothetical protein